MTTGTIVSLHRASAAKVSMERVDSLSIEQGRGVEGDRYFLGTGTFSDPPGPDRHVTLIELEAIESLEKSSGIAFEAGDARRNVVTRGLSLNDLVGRELMLGTVRLRGMRLCEPCLHLAKLTRTEGVLPAALVHRGGLRCEALSSGVVRVGDVVRAIEV